MTYCVAIVDEGLLDLTRFKTPDPHDAFYAREALGVKSFDLFDYVIGAWGGDLERILTIGGDADAGPVKQKTANRFKPVVKYLGPFHLKKRSNTKADIYIACLYWFGKGHGCCSAQGKLWLCRKSGSC